MSLFRRQSVESNDSLYSTLDSIDTVLEKSRQETVLILKHSATCPISGMAKNQMDRFLAENPIAAYLVVVQQQRPLSNQIAEKFQIRHESPQVLCLRNGEVIQVFNHSAIVYDNLKTLL